MPCAAGGSLKEEDWCQSLEGTLEQHKGRHHPRLSSPGGGLKDRKLESDERQEARRGRHASS